MTGTRLRDKTPGRDQELIGRLLAGEAGAEEEFLSRFRGLAIGLTRGRFGLDPLAANEIWQEVVLKLWADDHKALRNWRGEGRFSTYLSVIVVNACIRHESARSRQAAATEPLEAAAKVAGTDPSPDERADRRERQRALGTAMAELAPRDRLLLSLRFGDGHKPAQIGRLLGLSPGAVRKALYDARKRLRKRLLAAHPDLFSEPTGNATRNVRSHSSGGGE